MHTINIEGTIEPFTHMMLNEELLRTPEDNKTIRVNISSRGGDYFAALSIYNTLRETRKRIITSAQGFVGSAGAVILLAGDVIEAAANSVIMFHMPEYASSDPQNVDALMKSIEKLRVVEQSLISSLTERTKKSKEEIESFLRNEKWLTPEEAMDMKLIDKILPFKRRKVNVGNDAPVEILNLVEKQNQEVERMTLKSLCEQFSISVDENDTEETITNAITTHFRNLEERAKTKPEPQPQPQPKEKVETSKLPVAFLNMIKRSREVEINALVGDGKITAAVATDLKVVFMDETRIGKAVDEEGRITDAYEQTIDALRKNESVINLKGSTGVQVIPKNTGDNPLLKDAEKRAAQKGRV